MSLRVSQRTESKHWGIELNGTAKGYVGAVFKCLRTQRYYQMIQLIN